MTIGSDLLADLGVTLDFNSLVMTWEGATIPMKDRGFLENQENLDRFVDEMCESYAVSDISQRVTKILDADYHAADANEITASAKHLTPEQSEAIKFSTQTM